MTFYETAAERAERREREAGAYQDRLLMEAGSEREGGREEEHVHCAYCEHCGLDAWATRDRGPIDDQSVLCAIEGRSVCLLDPSVPVLIYEDQLACSDYSEQTQ